MKSSNIVDILFEIIKRRVKKMVKCFTVSMGRLNALVTEFSHVLWMLWTMIKMQKWNLLRAKWNGTLIIRANRFVGQNPIDFVWCDNNDLLPIFFSTFQCIDSVGRHDYGLVSNCTTGARGVELQLNAEKETHLIAKPYPSFIPTIVYNKVKNHFSIDSHNKDQY